MLNGKMKQHNLSVISFAMQRIDKNANEQKKGVASPEIVLE